MKLGRNDPCHCGSGKKYKHCCYATDNAPHEDRVVVAAPESERVDSDDRADNDEGASEGSASKPSNSASDREKGRERFHGSGKGKNVNFTPRVFRGAQRGN